MKPFLCPILLLASITLGHAHAFLDHAEPRVGSASKIAPSVVKIWFTEELEPAFSKIRVFDASQHEIDRRDVQVDSADKTIMTVSLPKLAPGNYQVIWDAVAVDTHHTHGTFGFQVLSP